MKARQIKPGTPVEVTWADASEEASANPKKAELFTRKRVGYVHANVVDKTSGLPALVLLGDWDENPDDLPESISWMCIPWTLISKVTRLR